VTCKHAFAADRRWAPKVGVEGGLCGRRPYPVAREERLSRGSVHTRDHVVRAGLPQLVTDTRISGVLPEMGTTRVTVGRPAPAGLGVLVQVELLLREARVFGRDESPEQIANPAQEGLV
jgi:hypothetical protein